MPSSNVEQIKDRLGIIEVISTYIKLEKAGSNMKARCPFHNEKTPSFFVSPSRNTFYCFGCGEKGDIFTFIEKFEGLDFQGALRLLGTRAGVSIVFESKESQGQRERLYGILESATRYFENNLEENRDVLSYLKERSLSKQTLTLWRIGYALSDWRTLHDHLTHQGFSTVEIEEAGLIKKSGREEMSADKERYYDRFRGRIMFPIFDNSGRVIAFSGRIFPANSGSISGGAKKADENINKNDNAPKYINSPETSLFHKSRILYGYNKAKLAIRKVNFSIVVEGQMDLLMCHQSGFTNTVALSGTALTGEQLTLLNRLSKNIVMAFDADSAGVASSGKGASLALHMGMDVKIAALPEGSDPADLVKAGKDKLRKVIRESKHIVDFYLDIFSASEKNKRKLCLKVGRIIIPFVAQIPNKIDQAHFVATIASRLSIAEDPVWEEVRNVIIEDVSDIGNFDKVAFIPKEQISDTDNTRKDIIEQEIVALLLWQHGEKKKNKKVSSAKDRFKSIVGKARFTELMKGKSEDVDVLVFEAEREFSEGEDVAESLLELLNNLEEEQLRERFTTALENLRLAEVEGKTKNINDALRKCKVLSEQLASVSDSK